MVGDATAAVGSSFAIDGPGEVLAWLRRLEQAGTPVTLSAAGGVVMATTILQVDPLRQRLALAAEAGSRAAAELIDADDVTAVTYLDAVKLQFDLHELTLVHATSSSAIHVPLPERLYRFQRRDAFRVRTGERATPVAEFRHPAMPDMRLALRVLDIGAGGCALLLPDDVPALPPGILIQGARLRMDADTNVELTLRTLHVSAIQPGAGGARLGCALQGLSGPGACALQRWIDRMQRRHRPFGG